MANVAASFAAEKKNVEKSMRKLNVQTLAHIFEYIHVQTSKTRHKPTHTSPETRVEPFTTPLPSVGVCRFPSQCVGMPP